MISSMEMESTDTNQTTRLQIRILDSLKLTNSFSKPEFYLTYNQGLHKLLDPTGQFWPCGPFIGLKFLKCGRACVGLLVTVPRHSLRPS